MIYSSVPSKTSKVYPHAKSKSSPYVVPGDSQLISCADTAIQIYPKRRVLRWLL